MASSTGIKRDSISMLSASSIIFATNAYFIKGSIVNGWGYLGETINMLKKAVTYVKVHYLRWYWKSRIQREASSMDGDFLQTY
jgi:hypothetical protein